MVNVYAICITLSTTATTQQQRQTNSRGYLIVRLVLIGLHVGFLLLSLPLSLSLLLSPCHLFCNFQLSGCFFVISLFSSLFFSLFPSIVQIEWSTLKLIDLSWQTICHLIVNEQWEIERIVCWRCTRTKDWINLVVCMSCSNELFTVGD